MAVVSAFLFVSALMLIGYVFKATLMPALPRIVEVLAGRDPMAVQPSLMVAAPRRSLRQRHPAARAVAPLREAA